MTVRRTQKLFFYRDDSLVIELVEPSTAGFLWSLQLDRGIQLFSERYKNADAVGIGSFPTKLVALTCGTPGIYKVVASLRRPWMKDAPPEEEVEYTIEVL